MVVEKNQKVTFNYTLWDSNGILIEKPTDNPPITYLHGYGHILPGLEEVLEGRREGESFRAEIPCEKAFGPYKHDQLISVPFDELAEIPELKVGMEIEMFQERIDIAEPRDPKDMFWTPQTPEDLFKEDSADYDGESEDDEDEEDEDAEIFIVREIRADEVILDGNPPLAGRDLVFEIQVLRIEPASFEEIEDQYLNDEEDEDLF